MINYDKLPDTMDTQGGFTIPDPGRYRAIIEVAEMLAPKVKPGEAPKPNYLNIRYGLYDMVTGEAKGKMFDMQSESEQSLPQYKLKRFILALGLKITGSFDLRDLCKVIINKQLAVDVKHEQKESYPVRAVVDVFNGEIYYPIVAVKAPAVKPAATAAPAPTPVTDFQPDVIDAPDAQDAEDTDY